MSLGHHGGDRVPPTNKTLIVIAALLMLIPVVALMWVGSYARATPVVAGFPFFFWYQIMWVILCGVISWIAYLCVRAARRGGDGRGSR